jgi:hypothetical protein
MDRRVGKSTTASQLFAAGRGVLFGEASHPGPPQRVTRPDIDVRVRTVQHANLRYRCQLSEFDMWASKLGASI